jgi:hypothetical protein
VSRLFNVGQEEEDLPSDIDDIDDDDERLESVFLQQRHCIYLACNTTGYRYDLFEVYQRFNNAQCTDKRDHLYGLLSLIDWRGRPPPIVDYDKNVFDVATEIMAVAHDDDDEFRVDTEMWARIALGTLKITVTEPSMHKAIKSRLQPVAASASQTTHVSRVAQLWSAIELRAHDPRGSKSRGRNGERLEAPIQLVQRARRGTHAKLVDRRGNLLAYATPRARHGDFLLTCHGYNAGLIARASVVHEHYVYYTLVGVATLPGTVEVELNGFLDSPGKVEKVSAWWHGKCLYHNNNDRAVLRVLWDMEDLLVFLCLLKDTQENLHTLLRTRLCRTKFLSYAKGSK